MVIIHYFLHNPIPMIQTHFEPNSLYIRKNTLVFVVHTTTPLSFAPYQGPTYFLHPQAFTHKQIASCT